MAKLFNVTKWFDDKHTEQIPVEANSEKEAIEKAIGMSSYPNVTAYDWTVSEDRTVGFADGMPEETAPKMNLAA